VALSLFESTIQLTERIRHDIPIEKLSVLTTQASLGFQILEELIQSNWIRHRNWCLARIETIALSGNVEDMIRIGWEFQFEFSGASRDANVTRLSMLAADTHISGIRPKSAFVIFNPPPGARAAAYRCCSSRTS
jgi:hypothetical protein